MRGVVMYTAGDVRVEDREDPQTGTAQHGAGPAAPMLCAGSGPAGVTAQVADVVREDLDVHEAAALDQLP